MSFYYHSTDFRDFSQIPENSVYVSEIDAAFALISSFDPSYTGNVYVHVFATDEQLQVTPERYQYRYRTDFEDIVIGSVVSNTTIPLPGGYLNHVGTYAIPMTKYRGILEKFRSRPPESITQIGDEIGNIITRI